MSDGCNQAQKMQKVMKEMIMTDDWWEPKKSYSGSS
jgi:hypothetical protein